MKVCTQTDEFTQEKHLSEARWEAMLTNGETIIQDDDRPGVTPNSAWERLGQYVQTTGLKIASVKLAFRDNVVRPVPNNAEGYFFCKALGSFLEDQRSYGYFLLGYLQEGKVKLQRWSVPELVPVEVETRDPAAAGKCLIRNNR